MVDDYTYFPTQPKVGGKIVGIRINPPNKSAWATVEVDNG